MTLYTYGDHPILNGTLLYGGYAGIVYPTYTPVTPAAAGMYAHAAAGATGSYIGQTHATGAYTHASPGASGSYTPRSPNSPGSFTGIS